METDYVSRQWLLTEYDKRHKGPPGGARKMIEEAPAADVRPVKEGCWIPVTNGRGGHECDQCHDYAPSYQTGEERLSDFCPRCGARMGGTP